MPKTSWAAVLFDLDGTLADTVGLILACFRHTMKTHLGEVRPDEEWIAGMGTPLRLQMRRYASSPEELDAMIHTYGSLQRELHAQMVSAYAGVPEMLAALEAARVPMGLVTSRLPTMTHLTLDTCGISRHFQVVITPEDVTRAKPDPEPVLVALQRLGNPPPERVLFVGDSPHDILSGRAAGVRTAGVLWGPFSRDAITTAAPDFIVDSPVQLLELRP